MNLHLEPSFKVKLIYEFFEDVWQMGGWGWGGSAPGKKLQGRLDLMTDPGAEFIDRANPRSPSTYGQGFVRSRARKQGAVNE